MREWCLVYFFKSLTDMYSSSICLAWSMSAASVRMHIDIQEWGMLESLVGWRSRYQSTNPCTGGEDVLHSSGEMLVSSGIVVFQTNLHSRAPKRSCYCMMSASDEVASHTSDTIVTSAHPNTLIQVIKNVYFSFSIRILVLMYGHL